MLMLFFNDSDEKEEFLESLIHRKADTFWNGVDSFHVEEQPEKESKIQNQKKNKFDRLKR